MSDANRKVLEMVEQKKITAAEGDALLAAMRADRRLGARVLVDPYERLSIGVMIAIGAGAAALSAIVADGLGVRFDGAMDIHQPLGAVTAAQAIADQVVAWPLSALALWLVALAFGSRGRLVDFLAAFGVARVLLLVAGALIAALAPDPAAVIEATKSALSNPAAAMRGFAQMIPVAAVSLVFVGWFIAAAVFAFRHASGLRGGRLAFAFIAALVAAEIVSKLALWAVSAAL